LLHILNGDALAEPSALAGLPGGTLVWREALCDGPTPAGLTPAAWRTTRAGFLAREYGVSRQSAAAAWRTLEAGLRASLAEDEVVLWFEQDLFCQANLLYVLAWYTHRRRRPALSLAMQRSFGDTQPGQIKGWFRARRVLRPWQLRSAGEAWAAYTNAYPGPLRGYLSGRMPWAGLGPALQAHLDRLPDPEDGLDRLERAVLWLVTVGFVDFDELFDAFRRAEPVYGFGDLQFRGVLRRLATRPQALLAVEPAGALRNAAWHAGPPPMALRVTRLGEAVLLNEARAVPKSERWVGGMHLAAGPRPPLA